MQISIANCISSVVGAYSWVTNVVNRYVKRVSSTGGYIEGIGCMSQKLSK